MARLPILIASRLWPAAAVLFMTLVAAQGAPAVGVDVLAEGFEQPLGVVAAGETLYVLEKTGQVRIVEAGRVDDVPFLDLSSAVSTRSERGLLGMTFWPEEAASGILTEVFVHYSNRQGDTVLARMPIRDGQAVPEAAVTLLQVDQPFPNHNGGQLAFGPDGYLYLGLGDGGLANDPLRAGQDPDTLLGKLLRLDVRTTPYGIPDGNRYAPDEGRAKVWAEGLRNPWRFSFDAVTNTLWVADVGQNATEEVNRVAAGTAGGHDFGWSTLEGDACFRRDGCDATGTTLPVATYRHEGGLGRSVTGGYVYRGDAIPDLQGWYVFGDFVSGNLLGVDGEAVADGAVTPTLLAKLGFPISSLGRTQDGELLVVDFGGRILRLAPR